MKQRSNRIPGSMVPDIENEIRKHVNGMPVMAYPRGGDIELALQEHVLETPSKPSTTDGTEIAGIKAIVGSPATPVTVTVTSAASSTEESASNDSSLLNSTSATPATSTSQPSSPGPIKEPKAKRPDKGEDHGQNSLNFGAPQEPKVEITPQHVNARVFITEVQRTGRAKGRIAGKSNVAFTLIGNCAMLIRLLEALEPSISLRRTDHIRQDGARYYVDSDIALQALITNLRALIHEIDKPSDDSRPPEA